MTRKDLKKSGGQTCLTVDAPTEHIDPRRLMPSPENGKIYRKVNCEDSEVKRLAGNIKKNGILEPLVVSLDGYILSGHRRQKAAILAGLDYVPCRRVEIHRLDDAGDVNKVYLRLLASYNTQRVKDHTEIFREVIIQTDSDEAYQALLSYRDSKATITAQTINVGTRGRRKVISKVKAEMVDAAIGIINRNRKYWPLSDRQIHYRLLNSPPLRNTKNLKSRYRNNRPSYQDVCDLLTRLRLTGDIPMHAIADPTRPTTSWAVHRNPQSFVYDELDNFLKGYRRNLQQTQPLHIEVVAEKMTVESIIRPICGRFNIPYTIGRGYPSLPARAEIVNRFRFGGKDRLLLLVLSDHDPEGINIGEVWLQSIREDFGEDAEAVRVGLNPDHIERFALIDNKTEAKKSSARYNEFVRRYGKRVYELEALTPEQLQQILTEAIDSIVDAEQFNEELDYEKQDAARLQALRETVSKTVLELLDSEDLGHDE